MLNLINNLKPFFKDCYRRISVREYSRIIKVSPPTASKLLFLLHKEGLLMMEKDRNYIFFYANKENKNFIDLSRAYWRAQLNEITTYFEKNIINPAAVLFGSISKAEVTKDSDIDIAIFGNKKELNIKEFESKLNRKIQILWFNSINDIGNKDLANNIINGYILTGRLKL